MVVGPALRVVRLPPRPDRFDQEAFALCEEVDTGLARLAKLADRLYHQRREAEIELFATALARDLISSEDFARQPGR